ncbi:MAG: response regulator [Candidatus Sulfotelmatobacter sp.]
MPPLISVVDDDPSVRESLESLIRSVGFAVKVFASAEEFLNSPRVLETNCLILDVRLPGMDGIELHRHLLAKKWKVPVIFITAHASEEHLRAQALRSGAVGYLIKPFSEESLLDAIDAALDSKSNGPKNP